MSDILEKVSKLKIVPLVVIDDPADAKPAGEALAKGGLPCAEIPFRTKAAAEAIKVCAKIPGMLVGAGTSDETPGGGSDKGAVVRVTGATCGRSVFVQ